jgi:hypothetical protein
MLCWTSLEYIEQVQFTLFHTSCMKFMFQKTMKYVHNQKMQTKSQYLSETRQLVLS